MLYDLGKDIKNKTTDICTELMVGLAWDALEGAFFFSLLIFLFLPLFPSLLPFLLLFLSSLLPSWPYL